MRPTIERLRMLSKQQKDRRSKSEAMVKKMKDQADAAVKVSQEVKAGKG